MLNQGHDYRERVGRQGAGVPVLEYLARRYRHSTRDQWRGRIAAGLVQVDGARPAADSTLEAGQVLVWRRPPWSEPDVPASFAVLHLDPHVLAVAKPSGLPTQPRGGFLENTLLTLVRRRWPEASPVHRLGRGTSGIVLFARTATARSGLAAAFRRREVRKIYRALVTGAPTTENFAIDVPIGEVAHLRLGTVHAASARGKAAHSRVQVLERRRGSALVAVRIISGRPHQIRIHLAAVGHPLVGDPLYGSDGAPSGTMALPGEVGYSLHAWVLGMRHPVTGLWFELQCGPPPVLRRRPGSRENLMDVL